MNRRSLFKLLALIPFVKSIPFVRKNIGVSVEIFLPPFHPNCRLCHRYGVFHDGVGFMVDGKWERGTSVEVADYHPPEIKGGFDYGKIEYPT